MDTTRLPLPILMTALLLTGCGVAGDKGAANFHVGKDWTHAQAIALGATFPVTANQTDALLNSHPLLVTSGLPTVVAMPGGSFQAVAAGAAQFQAQDPTTNALVDTLEFTVATPATLGLTPWWSQDAKSQLPAHFALVQNSPFEAAIRYADSAGASLHHLGMTAPSAGGPGVQVALNDPYVDVTPTALGATTLNVQQLTAQPKPLTTSYAVTVVALADVATVQLTAQPANPFNPGATTPAPAANQTWFLLTTACALADGTPVYGVPVTWTESGKTHLFVKTSTDATYALLTHGETVTVTATVGGRQAQAQLTD